VEILGPGDWFGVAALAKTEKHGLRAVAVGAAVISEATADQLYTAVGQKPEAAVELSRQLATKVQTARDAAADLIFQDCNDRLIQTLIRFSHSAAATPSDEGVVLRITHHQLAQAVGVARETVSLALTQLRHQNLLRTGRNQLTFNPEALKRFKCSHQNPRVKNVA
jgi:CRP-like cAMP-binding protein